MNKKSVLICATFLMLFLNANSQVEKQIKTIELVHHSHTDIGYTDNPILVMEYQKRYVDMALDAIIETADSAEGKRFIWTAEAMEPVYAWWQDATPERRSLFLKAIANKQLDVNALPFTIVPFTNRRQNETMVNWIPNDLWNKLNPKFGLMNDVNAFPRSLAMQLLDKGINHIWLSINLEWGGTPFTQPYAFWWKMPDGRKTLVWLNTPYWHGYELFSERIWVYGWEQVTNTQFRTPREGDMLKTDEKSVRQAHSVCIKQLQKLIDGGYSHDFIAYSITNQWRIDNDNPMPHLVGFVKKWNELGLKPALHLSNVSSTLEFIEKKLGSEIKTYEGEFPDWWSFGGSAAPREMAAARMANSYIEAIKSPVWGEANEAMNKNIYELDKQLCLFSEHTFASNQSVLRPYEPLNQGHIAEKNILAYRPYTNAKWMLAQRTRNLITNEPEGLYVINHSETSYTGWINLNNECFRGEKVKSLVLTDNQKKVPLIIEGNVAKFWVEQMPAQKVYRFLNSFDSIPADVAFPMPVVKTDANGWPVSAQWSGMEKPLFNGNIASFSSLQSLVGRELQAKTWTESNPAIRAKKVKEFTIETWATEVEKTKLTETAYSLVYEQKISHTRLNWATRKIEIWKNEARAQITVKFDRITSSNPEIFYLTFPLPANITSQPVVSNGDIPFIPYKDQIPGTCTDHFAIDGWVHYPSSGGSWIWSSRDMPNISFGSQQYATKSIAPPANMNNIVSMIYNNLWHVNYQDNYPGEMEFQYDLVWKNKITDNTQITKMVQTYNLPPAVMINPSTRENPIIFKHMNEIR